MIENNNKQQMSQTARDILSIFFFKKHVFIVTFVSVIVAALLLSFLFPPIYQVSAQLVIKPKIESPVLFDKESSRVNVDSRVDIQMINTVMQLIVSPTLLRAVVIKYELYKEDNEKEIQKAVAKLSGKISVEPLALSNMIQVTLKGGERELLPNQLNSLLDTYISYHIQVNQSSIGSLDFFKEQTENYKNNFIRLTHELASQSGDQLVVHPELQKEHILKFIKDLELNKSNSIIDTSNLKFVISQLKEANRGVYESNTLVTLPIDIMQRFPALEEMEKSLAQLIINKQRADNDYLPAAKQVQDANDHYNNMLNQISGHIAKLVNTLSNSLNHKNEELYALNKQIKKAQDELKVITINSIEMERLALEHSLAKNNYTLYNTKREEARINLEKDKALFANVSIASRPVTPIVPWFPQKRKILMFAFILAIFLGLGLSAAMHALDQRASTPYDIINKTNIRYLGSLDEMSQTV
jgi:uncharacterized protein involved in exopolysaccharide biosynthesis